MPAHQSRYASQVSQCLTVCQRLAVKHAKHHTMDKCVAKTVDNDQTCYLGDEITVGQEQGGGGFKANEGCCNTSQGKC